MTRHARTDPPRPTAARLLGLGAVLVVTATAAVLGSVSALPWQAQAQADPTPSGAPQDDAAPEPTSGGTPTASPTPTPPPDAVFTLVAAGDVLLHEPVIANARTADGGYDFAPQLAPVRPWVAGADLALCHLETPVAPPGTGVSGYPMFGGPAEIAVSLARNGWDGCSTASNHSVDRGAEGVVATLDALDAAGLGHVGTARTVDEAALPQVYELTRAGQTIRVAHLSATYGTNGLPVPADRPWMVSLIDTAALTAQATAARASGADVVVASVHCCVEYVSEPTDVQRQIAQDLAASGVIDLVIGHHAHVPQPIEKLPGGPRGEGMWVAHGLGNFISNQDGACCSPRTDSGLLMLATFRKPLDGPVSVTGVEWTSVTVDRGGGHRVEPMSAILAGSSTVGSLTAPDLATRHARVVEVVGTQAPERVTPPVATGPVPVVVVRGVTAPVAP